jgi:hypothetical protein
MFRLRKLILYSKTLINDKEFVGEEFLFENKDLAFLMSGFNQQFHVFNYIIYLFIRTLSKKRSSATLTAIGIKLFPRSNKLAKSSRRTALVKHCYTY